MTSDASLQKPKSVVLATKLLWLSLAIGFAKVAIDLDDIRAQGSTFFTTFILVIVFGALALFTVFIANGKNWARITFAVLFVVGLLPMMPNLAGEFSRSPALGLLSILQAALQGYAMFLVFTQPGASWYRRSAPA